MRDTGQMNATPAEMRTLFDGRVIPLLKNGESEEEAGWKFAGIASDEEMDTDGDVLMKSCLDLTYAKKRGFVNWNHSRDPLDQLGYLTKCELVGEGAFRDELEERFQMPLTKTASLYVEGNLYRHVKRAAAVRDILRSKDVPGYESGLGISVDGMMAKSVKGEVVKAFVRGVALSAAPAQMNTMCQLVKTLKEMREESGKLTKDEAIDWCLNTRPDWTKAFAERFVNYVINL